MPIEFKDRVPSKLGRVKITPENGGTPYYAVVERADEPSVAGTPLSAANLNAAQETLVYRNDNSVSTWRSVYVAPTGNDNNTGTEASPMKTIKGAIRKYAKWHKYMDVYLKDGTYTEDIGQVALDLCSLTIRGASENKDAVIVNITSILECHLNFFRLVNLTLNMTADATRAVTVNAGFFFASNVRFNLPATSTANCVNIYNGASAHLSDCVINPGTGAAVYASQGFEVRAIGCTSEKTVERGFWAANGSVIIYTPTLTATTMTYESPGGKCIPLEARPGSRQGVLGAQGGRYRTYDGLLMQWGQVSITPTAANTIVRHTLTFPIPYTENPLVFAMPTLNDPNSTRVTTFRASVADPKKQVEILLSRATASETYVLWFAIGKGLVDE